MDEVKCDLCESGFLLGRRARAAHRKVCEGKSTPERKFFAKRRRWPRKGEI